MSLSAAHDNERNILMPSVKKIQDASGLFLNPYVWLFCFALGLRLIYIAESTKNPLFGRPVVDAYVYDTWAAQMAAGQWLWEKVENYLPIYPFFLAIQKILFGATPWVNKLIQALMGALGVLLLAKTAAHVWKDDRVGLTAGIFMAAYWLLIVYESEKYAESFSIFFLTLTLYLLVCRKVTPLIGLVAGLSYVLAAGTRANLFLLCPFILAWIVWKMWGRRRDAALACVLFILSMGVILGPIMYHNHRISGAWMLRAQTGWSFYSGIDPRFEALPIPPGIIYTNYMRWPLYEGLRSKPEFEIFWHEKARQIIREQPIAVALNIGKRALLFLNAREFSKEFDAYAYRAYSRALSLPLAGFWLVGPLGVLGLFISGRRSKGKTLILVCLLVIIFSLLPFKFADRYRLTFCPLLAIFAGAALWRMIEWLRTAQWRPLALSLIGLIFLCLISWPDWFHLKERHIARHDYFVGTTEEDLGVKEEKQGKRASAIRYYTAALDAFERSMNTYPWDADSPHRIGEIYMRLEQNEKAMEMFKEALRREPRHPEVLSSMAQIYFNKGDVDKTDELTSASLQLFPIHQPAWMLRGKMHHKHGEYEKEIYCYEQGIKEGGGAPFVMALGLVLEDLGRLQDALNWYEKLVNSPKIPSVDRAHALMRAGYLFVRRTSESDRAREVWSMVLRDYKNETFYVLMAAYLTGGLGEAKFRHSMETAPESVEKAKDWCEYVIGLSKWMNGDVEGAEAAWQDCLDLLPDNTETSPEMLPQKWAWEDLQNLKAKNNPERRNKEEE